MATWSPNAPPATLDPRTMLARLTARAKARAEAEEGRNWFLLDDVEQHARLVREAESVLKENGIDLRTTEEDMTGLPPPFAFLLQLRHVVEVAWAGLDYGGPEYYKSLIESGWASIERFFAGWAEHEKQARKDSSRASRGAQGKAKKQREIIDAAIEQFDPGTGSKAHRARVITKRANEQGFEHADRLPGNLRKYLS